MLGFIFYKKIVFMINLYIKVLFIYLFIFWEGVIKVFCGSRVWSLCFWRVCRICYCLFFSILFCFVFLCGRVGFGGSCGCGFCSFGWGWISNICDCRFLIGVG